MQIHPYHLTYCSNIHAGETWEEIFQNIKTYVPKLKHKLSPDGFFGIGLRLSNIASEQLIEKDNIEIFKSWLAAHNCYVFTMNGFPYGGFHGQSVKDQVHSPDWTTTDRLLYTIRLAEILVQLLPENIEGGISTSPLSYKPWLSQANASQVFAKATLNFVKLVERLHQLFLATGKTIHIDIEPEPDGLIENSAETIAYFKNYLLATGAEMLSKSIAVEVGQAQKIILKHLQVCYDVCHFALEYESPKEAIAAFEKHGIKIGKIQISAALKAIIPKDKKDRLLLGDAFKIFAESTYLHQVSGLLPNGNLNQYRDLPEALQTLDNTTETEWRTHFHVPIFLSRYGLLQSTQNDIVSVLNLLQKEQFTQHLEIETYTWDVLPADMKTNIEECIYREYAWVLQYL